MELIIKATQIDEKLVTQLEEVIKENSWLFENEKIVLMADAHIGKIVPIGYTQTVSNPERWVSPDFVSSDIGCGVTSYLFKGKLNRDQLEEINAYIVKHIPVKKNKEGNSFGTLGGGNHFIEIGEYQDEFLISVHSGSRSIGGAVHQKYSVDARHEAFTQNRNALIAQLKSEGKVTEIATALKALDENYKKSTISVVRGYDGYFSELKEAVIWAQDSRRNILNKIRKHLEAMKPLVNAEYIRTIESIHNYIELDREIPIIRKGSIAAPLGTEVVIPLNMRDGIIVGISSVTEEVNSSLPHGAGRQRSRTKAFAELNFSDFKKKMKGIVSSSVVEKTLDESPDAYKDKDIIMKDIEPYLSEYKIFKTILNFKGVD